MTYEDVTTLLAYNGRGCGVRDPEYPYLCTGVSRWGSPAETFLRDPVPPWKDELHRGYTLVQDKDGITHVVIFVGKEPYPAPWDFFREGKEYGYSRKMGKGFPFDRLTAGISRMHYVHEKAIPLFEYQCFGPAHLEDPEHYRLHYCQWHANGSISHPQTEYGGDGAFWPGLGIKTGYHPYDGTEPCTYALQQLAYLVHVMSPHPKYKLEVCPETSSFKIEGPSFRYGAPIPEVPEQETDIAWGPGCFLSTLITHVEYSHKADEKSAERAAAADFSVKVVEW